MESQSTLKDFTVMLISALVLAFAVSYTNKPLFLPALYSFVVLLSATILVKKSIGYILEIDVETKFWSAYQFGFRKDAHFKRPLPLIWLPLLVSLFTRSIVWWFAVLEFDVTPRIERASKRHGLYRFTQVTEWHIAWIAVWGVITNVVLAIIGYVSGFSFFAELNMYYALWSLVPISRLDGAKIFFSSRGLWITVTAVVALIFVWAQVVI